MIEKRTIFVAIALLLATLGSWAQTVTGVVSDSQGEPLLGVTVGQKDTQNRTVTNLEGEFTLRVSKLPATLVFSYIGMKTKTVTVSEAKKLTVKLDDDATVIKDVEIVGAYGTVQKRSDLVGSAYQVGSKELENLPKGRLDTMLDGLVPGVKIDINSDVRASTSVCVAKARSRPAANRCGWLTVCPCSRVARRT